MAKWLGSATDPLWHKDAIIYGLCVRAFKDGNADGIGDFLSLIQKIEYLQDLGITCRWLPPFFTTPLKDDGYDVSDYLNVHPMYATIDNFREFLAAAHDRGPQVMIELVVTPPTSIPGFERPVGPRAARPSTTSMCGTIPKSDTKTPESLSRTQRDPIGLGIRWPSNITDIAFSRIQPDLNFENPAVVEEVLKIMRYWLDMGVDALRLDAIPYLVEREGSTCENLPETHAVIKALRREIDVGYSNDMLLAEATSGRAMCDRTLAAETNVTWAFDFPLTPGIYIALRQDDRLPITDIIAQTPLIPETCQRGLLRNHNELTLEMVTNDERDYMYLAYSADPRMRVNLGIRRPLAPLVDNNRKRIELLNSLLLSFPGTPILYHDNEIGMGDNSYRGDRKGVPTVMQRNADRNAGFCTANPDRLYSPVIVDPLSGYEAVEAQHGDPSSLLNWMRNMTPYENTLWRFRRWKHEVLRSANRESSPT